MVLVLAATTVLAYALVNAFGAWMVVRRKPWIAALFMLAASLLTVSFSALLFRFDDARLILLGGLVLASVASFLNAHIILGSVVWRFHVARAAVGAAIYLLAAVGLG